MRRFRPFLPALPALALALAACTDNGTPPPQQMDPPDMAEAVDMAQWPAYPGQPYGVREGDTLYPIVAKGYTLDRDHTDSSSLMFQDVKIADIQQNPKCKCLLLSESATWCGPCNAEQPELVQAVQDDPTFCVFNVLVDGPKPGVRATMQDVYNWTQTHGQNFPVVGANLQTYLHLPRPDALPTNVVIRPIDMKILSINAGLGPTTIEDAKALCAGK